MNIKTIKNLITLSVFAFLFVSAGNVLAYVPGVWDYQPRIQTNEPGFYKVPLTYDAPVVPQTSTTTYTAVSTPKKTVATTTTSSTTTKKSTTNTNSNTSKDSRELKPIVTEEEYNNNGLTALSLAGSGGFMPSSIWQWLLVIFLILVIIIIARMLGRSHTHEVHTVTAH